MRLAAPIAAFASSGCLIVSTYSTDPLPREAAVEVLAGNGHVYDASIAAAADSFLVTWTQHELRMGDVDPMPDIFFARAPVDPAAVQGEAFTPYGAAQLQSRAFCSSRGCGIVWGDDEAAGFPDRRVVWRMVDAGPIASTQLANVTSSSATHQRSHTNVAVIGDLALVAYATTDGEQRWHASLLDVSAGAVVREIELGAASWQQLVGVTAGESSFLVLTVGPPVDGRRSLYATMIDRFGTAIDEPILLAARLPADLSRPLVAGFHGGRFIIPVLDYEVVEVDRPCCPTCAVIQPPTCVIDDYHLYVVRLDEATRAASAPECLDCRTDVGTHVPLVATARDGVYFYWDDLLARVTATVTPDQPAWRSVTFPDGPNAFISRELHDIAALDNQILIVGRQRDYAASMQYDAFIARVKH